MDPRERINDPEEALRMTLEGWQATLHTSLPCIVLSVDYDKRTARLQPAIQAQFQDLNSIWQNVTITNLVDCPIIFPGGGGYSATFPLAKGDEVVAMIAERCIDAWWERGGVQPQADLRMHDLSDGFCLPRIWSQPTRPAPFSSTTARLQRDDGTARVEVGAGVVNVSADNEINLSAPVININGANLVQVESAKLVLHASTEWNWDVDGYGVTYVSTGGGAYTISSYTIGAVVLNVPLPIDPPGPLP